MQPPPSLPSPQARRTTQSQTRTIIKVDLKTVTPIMGGGTKTRDVDRVDVIRPPALRGQLRFWWRALFACRYDTASALLDAETKLWGGLRGQEDPLRSAIFAALGDDPQARLRGQEDPLRSAIDIVVQVPQRETLSPDPSDILLYKKDGKDRTKGSYALFPARSERQTDKPTAPRYAQGISFTLTLHVPDGSRQEVRDALQAWILFGGYGGRTRRGCGSVTVVGSEVTQWLPESLTKAELSRLFGCANILECAKNIGLRDVPSLRRAKLFYSPKASSQDAVSVWDKALQDWLVGFRQGPPRGDAQCARQSGSGNTPGRSNWPEADKVRRIYGRHSPGHAPRHNENPVWPRAGFGLPIIGQFKDKRAGDPGDFKIQWCTNSLKLKDRLASPLIIKPLALSDGSFVPVALWLYRGFPQDGNVCLVDTQSSQPSPKQESLAPFNKLVADGDQARFEPLTRGQEGDSHLRLRDVFLRWLEDNQLAEEIR